MNIKDVGSLSGKEPLGSAGGGSNSPQAQSESASRRVELKGSICPGVEKANPLGNVNPNEKFQVTVVLRRANALDEPVPGISLYPDGEAFARKHGARKEDMAAVKAYFTKNGLRVVKSDPKSRTVVLEGQAASYEKALGVKLGYYGMPGAGKFRAYKGSTTLPSGLADKVEGIYGLNTRPLWKTHFRFTPADQWVKESQQMALGRIGNRMNSASGGAAISKKIGPFSTSQVSSSYTAPQLAQLYNFPKGTDGSGQTVAIVEFGGGYNASDLQQYFQGLGMPMPDVESVGVDGATNSPTGDPNGPDGEVEMDVEAIGAMAPKAKMKVFFAPNNDQGSVDVLNSIMNDPDHPSVVSISWGGDESTWTPQTVQTMNNLFQEMAAKGITVIAAAGDDGSTDGNKDGKNHADFPASSPYVLGAGGTTLDSNNGKISSETVWNNQGSLFGGGAGGGGYSAIFSEPAYQQQAGITDPGKMRGVPDVASEADPDTGVDFVADGQEGVFGGTSLAAPTWAALVARMNQSLATQALGPVGFLNPIIYQILSNPKIYPTAFNDITQGNNGAFSAGPGWDACTGAGSPNGQGLLAAAQKILAQQKSGGTSTFQKVA